MLLSRSLLDVCIDNPETVKHFHLPSGELIIEEVCQIWYHIHCKYRKLLHNEAAPCAALFYGKTQTCL